MLENLFLGAVQGIVEWLPVSSEGLLVLIQLRFFGSSLSLEGMVRLVLFLHFGTFLAALIYFRSKVLALLKTLFAYQKSSQENQKILKFLIVSFLVSGLIGFLLLKVFTVLSGTFELSGKVLTFLIGLMLVITGSLQMRSKKDKSRSLNSLRLKDGLILGLVQGLAAIPGLSRSGTTVSALLLLGVKKSSALKLSFLMSLPIVLAGNIFLNLDHFFWRPDLLPALIASFFFGFLTIHFLIKLAEKTNFGLFVLFFGLFTLVSILI